jgi:hypothetical protein
MTPVTPDGTTGTIESRLNLRTKLDMRIFVTMFDVTHEAHWRDNVYVLCD